MDKPSQDLINQQLHGPCDHESSGGGFNADTATTDEAQPNTSVGALSSETRAGSFTGPVSGLGSIRRSMSCNDINSVAIMEPHMAQNVETTVAGATSVPEIDHTVKTHIDFLYCAQELVIDQLSQVDSQIRHVERSMDEKLQHFEKTLCEVQRGMETLLQLVESQSQSKPSSDSTPVVPNSSPSHKEIHGCRAQPYSSHVPNPHMQQPPCSVFPPPPSSFHESAPSHTSSGPGFGPCAGPFPPPPGPGGIEINSPFASGSVGCRGDIYQNLPTAMLQPGETAVRPSSGSGNRYPEEQSVDMVTKGGGDQENDEPADRI